MSLQGEATEVGRPHLFLRLGGCPLRCTYCDTPESWAPSEQSKWFEQGGVRVLDNPLSAEDLTASLGGLLQSYGLAASDITLAVTGGEPLLQHEFLSSWIPQWKGNIMLETAGLDGAALESLAPLCDSISLDWKLPSTLNPSPVSCDPSRCVEVLVRAGTPFWVKFVVAQNTPHAELDCALRTLASLCPETVIWIQPATLVPGGPRPPRAEELLELVLRNRHVPLDLRVLPQIHPILGAQ
ncbi:MAG: 7-carboxy-7-deazaguanine synthase QueE [Planctomycetes bacterium]|nr:7-carboxy-7-deazaguanine synthase QueE [Planctomycetota bacterium]